MTSTEPPMTTPIQSGLTIDGVAIPQSIEAEGPAAVEAFLASAPHTPAEIPPAPVVETAENPPTVDEGAES